MYDIDHWYSGDVASSSTGDLNTSTSVVKTQQRIVRRVLTNPVTKEAPADYIWNPEYGCGAARYVGETQNKLEELRRLIASQIILEKNVANIPIPTVVLTSNNEVLYIRITYVDISTGELQTLSFDTLGGISL